MGYTHYWRIDRAADQELYEKALNDCRKIVQACEEEYNLCNWAGDADTRPDYNDGLSFNGCEDDSHETFSLPAKACDSNWDFCKTARKPYDEVVVACLATLFEYDVASMSSDGYPSELTDGVDLASEVLGRTIPNPLENNDE